MSTTRIFNLIVVVVLLAMTALTVRQALATVQVSPSASGQSAGISIELDAAAEKQCPFSAGEQRSLRAEYMNGKGPWVANSESGYAGRQGGVTALLGCSR